MSIHIDIFTACVFLILYLLQQFFKVPNILQNIAFKYFCAGNKHISPRLFNLLNILKIDAAINFDINGKISLINN